MNKKVLTALLVTSLSLPLPLLGCGSGPGGNERWVTTQNSAVKIDWDAVGKAYKEAEGPEDLEKKVNEIYEGDEIISIAVRDEGESTQFVTGFFDKDNNGQVSDSEKIFEIRRDLIDSEKAQMQIQGYGQYAGYRSPMWDIASGMLMGSMLSRMFMPSYTPMYSRPYVTPVSRQRALTSHRNAYRAANPARFQGKSKSGRSYNNRGKSFGGGRAAPSRSRSFGRSRGGGRFGIRSKTSRTRIFV